MYDKLSSMTGMTGMTVKTGMTEKRPRCSEAEPK